MDKITSLLYVIKMDIVYSRPFRFCLGCGLYLYSRILRLVDRKKSDLYLLKAHHYSDSAAFQRFLRKPIQNLIADDDYFVSLLPPKAVKLELLQNKYMFLAKPYLGPREKGVIMVMWTPGFRGLHHHYDVRSLMNHYHIVLEPEWAGYAKPEILSYARIDSHPVVIQIPEPLDYQFIESLDSNFVPVEFGICDWLDHDTWRPIPDTEKIYDCVMVCDWFNYKRHYALFRALKKLKPRKLSIVLLSASLARKEQLMKIARYYGVEDCLTLMHSLPPEEVNRVYNQSRVNLLLTYKEGANKSLFEGMYANTPAMLLKHNLGVNKSYINEHTGLLIEEKDLPEALTRFADGDYAHLNPRQWMLDNASYPITTRKLNDILKGIAEKQGEEWTRDIAPKVTTFVRMQSLDGEVTIDDGHLHTFLRNP